MVKIIDSESDLHHIEAKAEFLQKHYEWSQLQPFVPISFSILLVVKCGEFQCQFI